MTTINKVCVIGAGVMGAGIAAHAANAGHDVLLLDIVPDGADNRNVIAETAIQKLIKSNPAALTHKRNAKRITPGNIEDHLEAVGECDWIVEAVIERLDIKQDLYKKLDGVRKSGSIVSSNTSTIPLDKLVAGLSDSFAQDFCITHFFNPPRYMRLLEIVKGRKPAKAALIRWLTLLIVSSVNPLCIVKTVRALLPTVWVFTGFTCPYWKPWTKACPLKKRTPSSVNRAVSQKQGSSA